MIDVVLITIALIVLLAASYSDLRTREVPDMLNFSLIFAGLGVRTIFSFELGWQIIISGVLGFLVCLILAYLFYYTGQWGGGDSKLLMGMGAIIGINHPFSDESFNLLWFFLGLLFLGAIYGTLWMMYLSIKKKDLFVGEFKNLIDEHKIVHLTTGVLSISFLGISFADLSFWPLAIMPVAIFYLFMFINAVENSCFITNIRPEKLTEGDWLAQKVKLGQKIIMRKKTLEINDIIKLRKLKNQGKINYVKVKEGIPFVPSFLFAYVLLISGKNILELMFQFI